MQSFGTSPHEPDPVLSADPIDHLSADISSVRSDPVKYITRHWRGDLSLPVSYWVNGQLFGIGYRLGAFFIFDHPDPSISYALLSLLIVIVIGLGMQVWQSVGIWRSADKYIQRGKRHIWAYLAQIAVVLGWGQTILEVGKLASALAGAPVE